MASRNCFVGYGNDIGFIHLSTKDQIYATSCKLFQKDSAYQDSFLVCVDLNKIPCVKWEYAKNKQLYPHVYGVIRPEQVMWTKSVHSIEEIF